MAGKIIKLSNGREWRSQVDAKAHFRQIRDRYPENTPITDPADHDDLCALLERYDASVADGPSKLGVGIRHFETRVNFTNGGRTLGFWVVREDGSETDFSFIGAIAAAPKAEAQQFSDACREAVHEQIEAAKTRFYAENGGTSGRIPCEITGELIGIYEARLEYAFAGFQDIVWAFRDANGWNDSIPNGVMSNPNDAQTTTTFVDPAAMVRFQVFHRDNAKMKLVARSVRRFQILAARAAAVNRPVLLG